MRIHFIAIGGSAMHNLAIALHKKGYQVSGSDDEIFDPAKTSTDFTAKNINGEMLQLHCGNHPIASNLINSRPEDLTLGNCLWVQFVFSTQHINHLKNPREDVWFSIKSNGEEYTSNHINRQNGGVQKGIF